MEKRSVPFRAMGGEYDESDVEAVLRVTRAACAEDGDFFPLPEENDFQDRLAAHEGARKAVAVNSCGTALDLCMMVLDVGPGDEVITTPLTFVCTAGTALARGARVLFADIDPDTMNLSPASVRERITDKTKAIIPVHFAGLAADIDGFDAITRDTGIPVIYDAAHAVGTRHKGHPIGGAGQASCYSFQSNKNMTCLGEGGAVTSNDGAFAEKVRQKKTFGYVYGPQLKVVTIGFNYRMTKAQYAVGLTQLEKIDAVLDARRERMQKMDTLLADVPELILPAGHGPEHGSHLYVVRLDTDRVSFSRDALRAHLKDAHGVGTVQHYPAVWSWDAVADLGYSAEQADCPLAAKACDQVISLPITSRTSPDDLEYVAWALKQSLIEVGA